MSAEIEVKDTSVNSLAKKVRNMGDQHQPVAVEPNDLNSQSFTKSNMAIAWFNGQPGCHGRILALESVQAPFLHPGLRILWHEGPVIVPLFDFGFA